MESKRVQTAKKFIGHFDTFDTDTLASVLAPDYSHHFAPASLAFPGALTKEQFVQHMGVLHKVMTGFPVYPKEYVESESSNQVTVWATSRAQFRKEVVGEDEEERKKWEFEGEYVFMFWMDESGEKIVRTVEFLDSKATEAARPLLKAANEKMKTEYWL